MQRTSISLIAVATSAMAIGPSMTLDRSELLISPNFRYIGTTKARRLKSKRYHATKSRASITRKHRHNATRKAARR